MNDDILHGRIAEAWAEEGAWYCVLYVGAGRRVVRFEGEPGGIGVGDVVAISLDEGGAASGIERLAGPSGGVAFDRRGDGVRWRRGDAGGTRMDALRERALIVREIRRYLDESGFIEVQSPLWVKATCPELHIDSVRAGDAGYLVTSTEYQLKRMIAGGFEKIYSLTQNFRAGDLGERHNPEFTMLEWARAFASLDEIEEDVERFTVSALLRVRPGARELRHGSYAVRMVGAPWERLTVREALQRYLNIAVDDEFSLASLRAGARRASVDIPAGFDEDAHTLVSFLLDRLQPRLGAEVPTFLREWPAFMTSSANPIPGRPSVAQRSELFIAGMEIADGFPSLQDAALQQETFARELLRRRAAGKELVAVDEKYVEALRQGLPPGAGMALGIDRLCMVLLGRTHIRDVLAFGWDEL